MSGKAVYNGQTIRITNANGQKPYDRPKLELCSPVEERGKVMWPDSTYYNKIAMGDKFETAKVKKVPIAQLSWAAADGWLDYIKGLAKYRGYNATSYVNRAMADHLLPIAFYANAKLIDWYMPRLEILLRSLDIEKAQVKGIVKYYPYGVHTKASPLVYNLPSGPEWEAFHEVFLDGKKLNPGQYTLKVENNLISVDLTPVKSNLKSSSRVSAVLDLGGIRVRSRAVTAAPDCGYWVLEDVTQKDEAFEWKGEGVSYAHTPGENRIQGRADIKVSKVLSYSAEAELSWGTMPEVIPTGGRWLIPFKGRAEKQGRPNTNDSNPGSYRASFGLIRAIPGPTTGVFEIEYSHEESISSKGLTGGVMVNKALQHRGTSRIKPGSLGEKKALVQFFLARPSRIDPSGGGGYSPTEFFTLTGKTPAGKLGQKYAYRFVKKLNPEERGKLNQTLASPLYRGAATHPKADYSAGSKARSVSGAAPAAAGGPGLTGLSLLPSPPKKQTPIKFRVDVVNPPEEVSYTWWMYKKFSEKEKAPQPMAWTKSPELEFTYGRAGTFYVTVKMKDKKTGRFVARNAWQIKVVD
ncbi:MAG: hypothetical protein HUK40_17245 [Desulfobacter sp.]|nr:hypothetical protein [Desulfobacter sp.]